MTQSLEQRNAETDRELIIQVRMLTQAVERLEKKVDAINTYRNPPVPLTYGHTNWPQDVGVCFICKGNHNGMPCPSLKVTSDCKEQP